MRTPRTRWAGTLPPKWRRPVVERKRSREYIALRLAGALILVPALVALLVLLYRLCKEAC